MRLRPFLLLPLLAACGGADAPLSSAEGHLAVRPEAVEFPRTFIGHPAIATLELINGDLAELPLEVRFAGEPGPFTLETGPRTLAGAEVLRLEVGFAPEAPGRFVARVTIDADRGGRTVGLSGVAEVAPPCDPADPCETATFDPATGRCHRSRKAEGEACSTGNPCQVDERCLSDTCVGAARDCDDGLRCTADSCDPAHLPDGCRHEDLTPTCPVPENPCELPVCDETLGCTLGPAPDQTRCGAFTCARAEVCIAGACTEAEVPDGWPCNAACGDGTCQAKECVRPEGEVLSERWSYAPADDETQVVFDGVVDEEGRFYWLERGTGTVLVSATLDGFVRFRAPLAGVDRGGRGELALAGEVAVAILEDGGAAAAADPLPPLVGPLLEARAIADGAPRWLRAVGTDLPGGPPAGGDGGLLLVPGDGTVRVLAATAAGTVLLAYDAATGAPLGATTVGPAPVAERPAAVIDESGAIYVGIAGPATPPAGDRTVELVALAPDGAERWRRTIEAADGAGLPVAAHGGLLIVAPARALEAADGGDAFEVAVADEVPGPAHPIAPLLGIAHGFAVDPATAEVVPFDREDGSVPGRGPIADAPPGLTGWLAPALTSREHALVASAWWADDTFRALGGAQVREVAADGSIVRTCAIPDPAIVTGAIAVRGNRLAISRGGSGLRVFELPRGETAGAGWTGPAGNAAGGRSAR